MSARSFANWRQLPLPDGPGDGAPILSELPRTRWTADTTMRWARLYGVADCCRGSGGFDRGAEADSNYSCAQPATSPSRLPTPDGCARRARFGYIKPHQALPAWKPLVDSDQASLEVAQWRWWPSQRRRIPERATLLVRYIRSTCTRSPSHGIRGSQDRPTVIGIVTW